MIIFLCNAAYIETHQQRFCCIITERRDFLPETDLKTARAT